MATFAFRTDESVETKLKSAARREKKTVTDIVHEALEMYFQSRSRQSAAQSGRKRKTAGPLEEFIGVWDGPSDASAGRKSKIGDYLIEKRRTRRV
jgi:predicted transcriptional regulator